MSEQRKKILEMLTAGTINADEAERLIAALESNVAKQKAHNSSNSKKPKFLHIKVEKEPGTGHRHDNVDIKIPIMLLKAGMKLGAMIPESSKSEIKSHLSDKGIHLDLSSLDSKDIDVIMTALYDSSIDIDTDKEKVRIFCK